MRNQPTPRSIGRRLAIAGYGTVAAAGVMTTALIAGVSHTAGNSTAATNGSTQSSTYGSDDDDTTKAPTTSTSTASTPTTSSSSSSVDTAPQNSNPQGGSNGS
jgi:hypothetical protein